MRGAIPPLHLYAFMAWCLVKHRDNFTFFLYLVKEQDPTKAIGRNEMRNISRSYRMFFPGDREAGT
jgi:hypothetical protein